MHYLYKIFFIHVMRFLRSNVGKLQHDNYIYDIYDNIYDNLVHKFYEFSLFME